MTVSNRPEPLKLLTYQEQALEYAKNRSSIFLLMDTGLGKTLTALHICKLHSLKKILCVVPKSVIENWAKHIRQIGGLSYDIALGNRLNRIEVLQQKVDIVLINFEGVRTCIKEIKDLIKLHNFDGLIVDELSRVRRYSQQTKALREISKLFRIRIGLSGLLISENLTDCFNPFYIIDLGASFGLDWFKFREKYFDKIEDEFGYYKYLPTQYGMKMIPALIKRSAFIVKSEDVDLLPPVSFSQRRVSLSEQQIVYLRILEEEWKSVYKEFEEKKEELYNYTIQIMQKAMQCISGFIYKEDRSVFWFDYSPKHQELNAIIEELGNNPFIVWCNYKAEQVSITAQLEQIGKKVCPNDNFNTFDTSDFDVCVCSYQRDSQGINLKKAKTAIFFSRPTSYDKFHQALGRNRRVDSSCKIINYQMIQSKHKIEIINDNALRKKRDLANLIREMKIEGIWKN